MNELFPKLSLHGRTNDKLLFSFSSCKTDEQSTTILNAEFMYSQLIVNILTQIEPMSSDQTQFVELCKNEYRHDNYELRRIDSFILQYKPMDALLWYTRDSFVYRLLNKAFRLKNIDLLFLFRFFIRDLYHQLQELSSSYEQNDILRVYRGQSLKPDEFKRLKSYVGGFISLNGFTSTSRRRSLAELYAGQNGVLFDIECHPCHLTSSKTAKTPYGDISSVSEYGISEAEVLFIPGSIFRIDQIENNDSSISIFKLILIADDDINYPLQQLHRHIQERLLDEESNGAKLIRLGTLLQDMGMRDKAGQYYRKLLEINDDKEDVTDYVRYAMEMYDNEKPNDETLDCFLKELEKLRQTSHENHQTIINCHGLIGLTYHRRGNIPLALEHHHTALHLALDDDSDPSLIAVQYQALASVYQTQGNYRLALENYQHSLVIREKCLPQYHVSLADSYKNIAHIYHYMKNYEESLNYHMKTLEIQVHCLTSIHHDLGFTYWKIATNYQSLKKYEQAKEYYQKGFDIFQKNYADNDEILRKMEDIMKHNETLLLDDQTALSTEKSSVY